MDIIRLPKELPGQLDLVALNQRLHTSEARLDWSEVEPGVPTAALRMLLAGLNLTEHLNIVGAETVSDALAPAIIAALDAFPQEQEEEASELAQVVTPDLWAPPEEVEQATDEGVAAEMEEVSSLMPTEKLAAVKKPLLQAPSPAAMRDELEELVIRDLLGPAGGEEEEVTEARLRERYLVGMLAPPDSQTPPEEQESAGTVEEGVEEQGPIDNDSSQTTSLSPSTMGLSFCVDLEASQLLITARWGHYQRAESGAISGANGKASRVWKRTPRGGQSQPLPLKEGPLVLWQVPMGNQYFDTMNNSPGHYQDNRAEYILGHVASFAAAGIISVLFGPGNGGTMNIDQMHDGVTNPAPISSYECNACNTHVSSYPDDDGGYLRLFIAAYLKHPLTLV